MTPPRLPRVTQTAVCASDDANPEDWFPADSTPAEKVDAVKALCRNVCPFTDSCLSYGLAHKVEGVWGGRDADERAALRELSGITPVPLTFGKGSRGWGPEGHGTPARYRKHLRDGDESCVPCREAHNRSKHPENNSQWQAS